MFVPVLDPGLLHAVLQVRGLIAKEHVTGAGGGVAGCCMKLPFDITHCMRNGYLSPIRTDETFLVSHLIDEHTSATDPTLHVGVAAGSPSAMSG